MIIKQNFFHQAAWWGAACYLYPPLTVPVLIYETLVVAGIVDSGINYLISDKEKEIVIEDNEIKDIEDEINLDDFDNFDEFK